VFTVVGAAVYFAVYTTYISRVRWEEALEHRRISGRERIYPALLGMAAERPLQGWGAEKNRRELAARVPQMEESALDAHNLYLHVLTEVGIVGSLPFVVALALSLQAARRSVRTRHGLLPLVLLCSVLVASLASTWILRKPFWFFIAYAVAAGSEVRGGSRRRRVRQPYPLPSSNWGSAASREPTGPEPPEQPCADEAPLFH
jgi:O-antigen ligase